MLKGLFAGRGRSQAAINALNSDEDIAAEAATLAIDTQPTLSSAPEPAPAPAPAPKPLRQVPLGGRGFAPGQGGHRPHAESRALLNEAGGRDGVLQFTNEFYRLCFADPHIDKFIRAHDDPHGERFASWITEKVRTRCQSVPRVSECHHAAGYCCLLLAVWRRHALDR
eukprot:SAG31_NODE_1972_length_6762_cov_16.244635_8_plen_168_part_00